MNAQAFDAFSMSEIYRSLAWALGPTVVAGVILAALRLRRRLSGQGPRPSEDVQKTVLASLDGGLPADVSLIANVGRNAAPHQTLNENILRPTTGLRLLMYGFPVLLYVILVQMQSVQGLSITEDVITVWASAILFVLMVHNILYFSIYELRYDTMRIVHLSWLYRRVELDMAHLLSIRDDGMYFYILRSDDGKKAYIPKHLTGIEDFVRQVRASISSIDRY